MTIQWTINYISPEKNTFFDGQLMFIKTWCLVKSLSTVLDTLRQNLVTFTVANMHVLNFHNTEAWKYTFSK